jgi:hypothetical protein
MPYYEDVYPLSKLTGINLCNNVRDPWKDALLKNTNGFDVTESLIHAANTRYGFKVERTKEIAKAKLLGGLFKSYYKSTNINKTILLEELEQYTRAKQSNVLVEFATLKDIAQENYNNNPTTPNEILLDAATAKVNAQIAFMALPVVSRITSIQLCKPYSSFYVARHTLNKYGHAVFYGFNKPYNGLQYSSHAINVVDSTKVLIYYNTFEEEITIPSTEDFHVIYEVQNAVGNYVPVYITSEDSTYLQSLLGLTPLDIEFHPSQGIKQRGLTVRDLPNDPANILIEELLRNLYISVYTLTDEFTKHNSNNIKEIYFTQGIALNTKEHASIHYLYEFFKWANSLSTITKEVFDAYKNDQTNSYLTNPYTQLLENIISIKSFDYESQIIFNFIDSETIDGVLGRIGFAKTEIIEGTKVEVKYNNINQQISQNLNLGGSPGSNSFEFGVHGDSIYYDTSVLEIFLQTSKKQYTKLSIHGLKLKNILRPGITLRPVKDLIWGIDLYNTENIDPDAVYQKQQNTCITALLDDLSGFIIPLFDHKIRTNSYFYNSIYNIRVVERVYYDSLNIAIFAEFEDKQIDPYLVETPDPWIAKVDREAKLKEYLSFYTDLETDEYKQFKDDITVAVNVAAYRVIPRKKSDGTEPVFLKNQARISKEIVMLTQGNKSNLYNDRDSHTNNALTGVYKPKVFIEPFINIGDKYKKPMFNN